MKSDTSLFPGYKHVEAFSEDDDYEEEEEVCYVSLDLGSIDQTLVPSSSSYRLIGLDTPTPFLQIAGTIMKGRPQTLIGTELVFKEDADNTNEVDRAEKVSYFCTAEKRINFREVEVKPKKTASSQVDTSVSVESHDIPESPIVPMSAISTVSTLGFESISSAPQTPVQGLPYADQHNKSFNPITPTSAPRNEPMDVDE